MYTPNKLLDVLNLHPQANAVEVKSDEFKNWNELQNKMVKKMVVRWAVMLVDMMVVLLEMMTVVMKEKMTVVSMVVR